MLLIYSYCGAALMSYWDVDTNLTNRLLTYTEMRKESGGCIVNLLKDENVQKKRECRAILEQRSSEMLFCPDSGTRRFLVPFLTNLRGTLQADQHTERLSTTYRTQTLEINKTTIRQSSSCFVNHGMFQGRKVIII